MIIKVKTIALALAISAISVPVHSAIIVGASTYKKAVAGNQFAKDLNHLAFRSAQVSSILLFLTGSPVVGGIFVLDENSTVDSIQDHLIDQSPILADLPELSLELSKHIAHKIATDDIHPLDKNDKVTLGAISLEQSVVDKTLRKTNTQLNDQDYKNLITLLK